MNREDPFISNIPKNCRERPINETPLKEQPWLPINYKQIMWWYAIQHSVMGNVIKIRGLLDPLVLEKSINYFLMNHPVIFSIFSRFKTCYKIAPFTWVNLKIENVRDKEDARKYIDQQLAELAQEPYTLDEIPQFRVVLYQLAEDHFELLYTTTHLVMDVPSLELVFQGIFQNYALLRQGKKPLSYVPSIDYVQLIDKLNSEMDQLVLSNSDKIKEVINQYQPLEISPSHFKKKDFQLTPFVSYSLEEDNLQLLTRFCQKMNLRLTQVLSTLMSLAVVLIENQMKFSFTVVPNERVDPELSKVVGVLAGNYTCTITRKEDQTLIEYMNACVYKQNEMETLISLPFARFLSVSSVPLWMKGVGKLIKTYLQWTIFPSKIKNVLCGHYANLGLTYLKKTFSINREKKVRDLEVSILDTRGYNYQFSNITAIIEVQKFARFSARSRRGNMRTTPFVYCYGVLETNQTLTFFLNSDLKEEIEMQIIHFFKSLVSEIVVNPDLSVSDFRNRYLINKDCL